MKDKTDYIKWHIERLNAEVHMDKEKALENAVEEQYKPFNIPDGYEKFREDRGSYE